MAALAIFEHLGLSAPPEVFERTVAFYEDVFGWCRFERDLAPSGGGAFLTDGAGAALELYRRENQPIAGANHLALVVGNDRFAEVCERARRAGAEVGAPVETGPGARTLFLSDPAGNRIQLSSRRAPFVPEPSPPAG